LNPSQKEFCYGLILRSEGGGIPSFCNEL